MNKKIIISCILGISTMMLMTGCGRQTEEPQDEIKSNKCKY